MAQTAPVVLYHHQNMKTGITHDETLAKRRKKMMPQERCSIHTGNETIITEHQLPELGTVLVEEALHHYREMDFEGQIADVQEWTYRLMAHKDRFNRIMLTRLIPEPELGLTPYPGETAQPASTQRLGAQLKSLITRRLGPNRAIETLYPMVKHYWNDEYGYDSGEVIAAAHVLVEALHGAKSATDLATNLFGTRNLRKDLVKGVAQAPLSAIAMARLLWDDSMPIDWVVNLLNQATAADAKSREEARNRDYSKPDKNAHLRKESAVLDLCNRVVITPQIITALDAKTRAKLLRRGLDLTVVEKNHRFHGKMYTCLEDQALYDASRNLAAHRHLPIDLPTSASNWRDLEKKINIVCARAARLEQTQIQAQQEEQEARIATWLSTPEGSAWLQRRDKAEQERELRNLKAQQKAMAKLKKHNEQLHKWYTSFCETFEKMASKVPSGFTYRIATSQDELREWGRTMNNCIAGYSVDVLRTGQVLLGVYDTRAVLIANIAITLSDLPRVSELEVRGGPHAGKQHDLIKGDLLLLLETIPEAA